MGQGQIVTEMANYSTIGFHLSKTIGLVKIQIHKDQNFKIIQEMHNAHIVKNCKNMRQE